MEISISGNKTEFFCIIGMPARHSLSPAIHNAAFKALGIDAVFLAFDVDRSGLKGAIESMRIFGIKGMTLTSPHKEEALKYIDRIDKTAERIGAVNTLINSNGTITGFHTDGLGFISALREHASLDNKSFAVIGAGGAARAFAYELFASVKNPKLAIINRQSGIEHAYSLASDLKKAFGADVGVFELNGKGMEEAIARTDILINATTVTLENDTDTPIDGKLLRKGMIVFDANYVPLENKLIRDAQEAGCIAITGDALLLHQGIFAFKLFTGRNAPVDAMKDALMKELKK